jgi:hypothetical protein
MNSKPTHFVENFVAGQVRIARAMAAKWWPCIVLAVIVMGIALLLSRDTAVIAPLMLVFGFPAVFVFWLHPRLTPVVLFPKQSRIWISFALAIMAWVLMVFGTLLIGYWVATEIGNASSTATDSPARTELEHTGNPISAMPAT